MPTCPPVVITPICQRILALNPGSVLDIGLGNGKWGFLAREYTDVWLKREARETRIDGIEIYGPYITEVQRLVYDNIYVGDALQVLPGLGEYDLVIMADVLEHLGLAEGGELLGMIRRKAKHAVVTTPVKFFPQGAVFGNEHERHVSLWTAEMLSKWGSLKRFEDTWLLEM